MGINIAEEIPLEIYEFLWENEGLSDQGKDFYIDTLRNKDSKRT